MFAICAKKDLRLIIRRRKVGGAAEDRVADGDVLSARANPIPWSQPWNRPRKDSASRRRASMMPSGATGDKKQDRPQGIVVPGALVGVALLPVRISFSAIWRLV